MIRLIVAMDENNVIGVDGKLPWHLPNDMTIFKNFTTDYTVVMGRKTFESIGKALPNRKNIIISSNKDLSIPNCEVIDSLDYLEELEDDFFVIGGESLYKHFLPSATMLYITRVHTKIDCGDSVVSKFPDVNFADFSKVFQQHIPSDDRNEYAITFEVYQRNFENVLY